MERSAGVDLEASQTGHTGDLPLVLRGSSAIIVDAPKLLLAAV